MCTPSLIDCSRIELLRLHCIVFHVFGHAEIMSILHTCCSTIQLLQLHFKAKEKYRGVFEIQWSGDKTSSGEIGLDIRTHASPKVGQDQVSGGVSVLRWHAAPVAYVPWKPRAIR